MVGPLSYCIWIAKSARIAKTISVTVEVLRVGVMIVGVISVGVMTVGVLSVGVMTLSQSKELVYRPRYLIISLIISLMIYMI